MNVLHNLRLRPWTLVVLVIGLLAAHIILFHFLWGAGLSHGAVSGAFLSGVVLLLIAKHLGLFGGLLGSLYIRFRRRSRSCVSEQAKENVRKI